MLILTVSDFAAFRLLTNWIINIRLKTASRIFPPSKTISFELKIQINGASKKKKNIYYSQPGTVGG